MDLPKTNQKQRIKINHTIKERKHKQETKMKDKNSKKLMRYNIHAAQGVQMSRWRREIKEKREKKEKKEEKREIHALISCTKFSVV